MPIAAAASKTIKIMGMIGLLLVLTTGWLIGSTNLTGIRSHSTLRFLRFGNMRYCTFLSVLCLAYVQIYTLPFKAVCCGSAALSCVLHDSMSLSVIAMVSCLFLRSKSNPAQDFSIFRAFWHCSASLLLAHLKSIKVGISVYLNVICP